MRGARCHKHTLSSQVFQYVEKAQSKLCACIIIYSETSQTKAKLGKGLLAFVESFGVYLSTPPPPPPKTKFAGVL